MITPGAYTRSAWAGNTPAPGWAAVGHELAEHLRALGVPVQVCRVGFKSEALFDDAWLAEFNGCAVPVEAYALWSWVCAPSDSKAFDLPSVKAMFAYVWNSVDRRAAKSAVEAAIRLGGSKAVDALIAQSEALP